MANLLNLQTILLGSEFGPGHSLKILAQWVIQAWAVVFCGVKVV